MSNTTNSVVERTFEHVLDERLPYQKNLKYDIKTTPANTNMQIITATSATASGLNFSTQTQSSSALIDKALYVKIQFKITINATGPAGQRLFQTGVSAPRAMPLSSIVRTAALNINGKEVSIANYSTFVKAMLRFNNSYDLNEYDLSGTCTYQDLYQQYIEGLFEDRNPLNGYSTTGSGGKIPRGGWIIDTLSNPVSAGVAQNYEATFTVYEPIFLSPFLKSKFDTSIGNVNNISLNLSFNGNLQRIWSQAVVPGWTINGTPTVEVGGVLEKPEMHLLYITPPATYQPYRMLSYMYYEIQVEKFLSTPDLAAGAERTFTSPSIQLGTVPRMLYIFCKKADGDETLTTTDTFFRLKKITLHYLNDGGQFSSFLEKDLYNLSQKNGLQYSWQEWSEGSFRYNASNTGTKVGLVGGILAINYSDLRLQPNVTAGLPLNGQLQYTITIENISGATCSVELNTIIVTDGVMAIGDNTMQTQTGIITSSQVIEQKDMATHPPMEFTGSKLELLGGGFMDTLMNYGRKALNLGKTACDNFDQVHAMADPVLNKPSSGGLMLGNGGAAMSKAQLRRNLLR